MKAWLVLVAAAFIGYATLLIYGDLTRPDPPGFSARFENGRPVIGDVRPGSAASRAGLRGADQVLAVNDHVITARWDWSALEVNMEYGRPWRFTVLRAGARVNLVLNFERTGSGYLLTRDGQVLFGVRLVLFITLILSLVVAFRRPRDPIALLGAWLLASIGVFSLAWPYRTAAIWRGLPAIAGLPLWLPLVSTWAIGALFFVFFSWFPQRRPRPAWYWPVVLSPLVVAMAAYAPSPASMVYAPDRTTPFSSVPFAILLAVNVGYVVAGLLTLAGTYRRLVDVNERRRVRVLAVGSAVGLAAGIPVVILFRLAGRDLTRPLFASGGVAIAALGFLVFPLSFVYAILRHRLFDVRVIIRSGVRYALARRALLSIVPALAVVLLVDVLVHGDQPLMAVVRARGAFYLAIAIAAVVAHRQRRRWLDALDRRFFREQYDARQLIGRLVADIRHVGSVDLVAPRAVAQIDAALHPASVTLYVRAPAGAEFRAVASVPPERAAAALSRDMTLLRLIRVLGQPVDVGSGWLDGQLPPDELELLRGDAIELIAPVSLGPDRIEALLALGVKRSEEPYGREDLDLISAIADSLAPLLDHPRASGTEADAFGECPACGTCYDTGTVTCRHEHSALATMHLPRVLASRYRLDRRLGRGGMGTVYAATDTALERVVAAKVIRAELAGNTDAALRFQQEARFAARFTHPHVVTVHDFGVTAGRVGFLVMELLDGRTLRAALHEHGSFAPRRAVDLLRGVASAVDAAHRLQLIHRDLKPENIFLVGAGADERAKVLDFGVAKSLVADAGGSRDTVPGALIGTPLYMAPEQLRGFPPSPLWDLWALAVITFEMLTGDHPFADTAAGASPTGPAGYEERIAARLRGEVSVAGAFFARALAIDPARRPQTAAELIEAFGDLVN